PPELETRSGSPPVGRTCRAGFRALAVVRLVRIEGRARLAASSGEATMIKRCSNLSFLFLIPGAIGQVAGVVLREQNLYPPEPLGLLATVLLVGGTLMAIMGFAYHAKAKGRSLFWGIVGFLGFIGLLVLAVLKDRSGDPWTLDASS